MTIPAPLVAASRAINALCLIDRPAHRRCVGQGRRTLHLRYVRYAVTAAKRARSRICGMSIRASSRRLF
jgi:hypothetical protein